MSDSPIPLKRLGEPDAAACEGDACVLPVADDEPVPPEQKAVTPV
jgi:hypothetical protein